jgi:hypothetical protein
MWFLLNFVLVCLFWKVCDTCNTWGFIPIFFRCSWCVCDAHRFPTLMGHQVQVQISKSLWRPTHTKTLEVTSVSRSHSEDPAFKDKHKLKSFSTLPLSHLWSLCIRSQALRKCNGGFTVQLILHSILITSLCMTSQCPHYTRAEKLSGIHIFFWKTFYLFWHHILISF